MRHDEGVVIAVLFVLIMMEMRHDDNDGGILKKSMAMVTLTMVVILR